MDEDQTMDSEKPATDVKSTGDPRGDLRPAGTRAVDGKPAESPVVNAAPSSSSATGIQNAEEIQGIVVEALKSRNINQFAKLNRISVSALRRWRRELESHPEVVKY